MSKMIQNDVAVVLVDPRRFKVFRACVLVYAGNIIIKNERNILSPDFLKLVFKFTTREGDIVGYFPKQFEKGVIETSCLN